MTTIDKVFITPTHEQWCQIQEIEPKGYLNLIGYYQEDEVIIVEWDHIDVGFMILSKRRAKVQDRKEISVEQFLDLLHDRIVPWRLEEVGVTHIATATDGGSVICGISLSGRAAIKVTFPFDSSPIKIELSSLSIDKESRTNVVNNQLYLATFSELLQQIRFLTPPTE